MHELLRYDNGHPGAPEEYHRHEYDRQTGMAALRVMSRQEFPTLAECIDEVADLGHALAREQAYRSIENDEGGSGD